MNLRLGRVTSTEYRNGVVTLNIQLDRKGVEERNVPLATPMPGMSYVPNEGEMVVVSKLRDESYIAIGFVNSPPFQSDRVNTEELAFQFNENNSLSIEKNGDSFNVNLDFSDEINISSENDVRLEGENIDVNGIVFGDHTHIDSEGGTTSEPQ